MDKLIDRDALKEHRWAMFYMTGQWPPEHVDHIVVGKAHRADNRWDQLRVASRGQNFANREVQSNSLSGVKGVSRTRSGRWMARVGGREYLGTFDTQFAAVAAVNSALAARYGDFALPAHGVK